MNKHEFISSIKGTGQFRAFLDLISTKQYDKIYEYYGKIVYMVFAPHSYKKKDINKLMEQKRYGEIYSKYGEIRTIFIKNFIKNITIDIDKMIDEGRFEDIYRKYGLSIYENPSRVIKYLKKDIINETNGMYKFKLYKSKYKLSTNLKSFFEANLSFTLSLLIFGSGLAINCTEEYNNALITYNEEINEYNQKIVEYADYINSLGLTDLQIIMKVMNDIWDNMKGYGEPELDVRFFERLDLLDSNGTGVCRNIADDFTAKINAINSEYNARNIIVYVDPKQFNDESTSLISHISGNHVVTILTPINCDYNIIVDSTNFYLGVVSNGNIQMFIPGKESSFSYKIVGEFRETYPVYDDTFFDVNNTFLSSIFNYMSEEKLNSIINEYGVDAQNEALDYIERLNSSKIK